MSRTVLVVEPTTTVGRAVLEHLLTEAYGRFTPVAMLEAPESEADALPRPNNRAAAICTGDLDDVDSYREHLEHVDAAVLVSNVGETGRSRELARSRRFVDALGDAGVDHLVYVSTLGADHPEAADAAGPDTAARIEAHVLASEVPATILRPGVLIQDLLGDADRLADGELAWPVGLATPLALVDVDDVGRTVATALADPERFVGVDVDLAGDVLTLEEIADGVAEVLGHDVTAISQSFGRAGDRFGALLAEQYAWVEHNGGQTVDTSPLQALGIQPRSLFETLVSDPDLVEIDAPMAD